MSDINDDYDFEVDEDDDYDFDPCVGPCGLDCPYFSTDCLE